MVHPTLSKHSNKVRLAQDATLWARREQRAVEALEGVRDGAKLSEQSILKLKSERDGCIKDLHCEKENVCPDRLRAAHGPSDGAAAYKVSRVGLAPRNQAQRATVVQLGPRRQARQGTGRDEPPGGAIRRHDARAAGGESQGRPTREEGATT